jgi:hypothetical protein
MDPKNVLSAPTLFTRKVLSGTASSAHNPSILVASRDGLESSTLQKEEKVMMRRKKNHMMKMLEILTRS